jgi:hypothetical protein
MAAIIKNLKILKRAKAAVFKASNGSNFKFTRLLFRTLHHFNLQVSADCIQYSSIQIFI